MTAEVQTLNFITHKLERLPLKDNYGAEKLPALFCLRGLNEFKDKTPKRFRVSKVASTNLGEDRVSLTTNSRFIYACARHENERPMFKCSWLDDSSDLSALVLPVKSSNGEGELNKQNQNILTSPNKRKRSTDSSGSDRESSKSDDEVRRIYRTETKSYRKKLHKHLEVSNDQDLQLDVHRKGTVCPEIKKKLHPELKRYKNRPSLSFEQMQRSSWFPFRLRSGERKIKVIRVSPYQDESELDVRPPVSEDSLFRPINVEDLQKIECN